MAILFLLLFPLISWSFPVLHFIKPESTFTEVTTLDACTTYLFTPDLVGCNPALFPFIKDEGVRMGLLTVTDGESVDVGQKLLFDPIKKDFLERLFAEQSFNSWGANSYIELRTSKFFLAYVPLSVNADIFVFNPSSPEVAMSLIKSNRLRVTTGHKILENDTLVASLGGKAFYYRSESYQDSFFLSDLAGQDVKDLIKFKNKSGVAFDLGGFLQFKDPWFPKVSFLLRNLNTKFHPKEEDIVAENQMRPLFLYETFSRIGIGKDYKASWGVINGEVNFPFESVYQSFYSEYISASLSYSLSRFTTNLSYSKYQQIFGFNFGSRLASVGIFYGRTRPLGDFSKQTESLGGLKAEVSL